METRRLPTDMDILAPDGSEIRVLLSLRGASFVHCVLPPGRTSLAVRHQTVEEFWYVLDGKGEVWRKHEDVEDVVEVASGACLTIPLGTHFQFRCTGDESLCLLIATLPPWPRNAEAVRVPDHWEPR